MAKVQVQIRPRWEWTRLLVRRGEDEILKAVLPAPSEKLNRKAASTLLEGLAMWLGEPLSVVLSVDEPGDGSELGLCDGFGFGQRTLHYEVEVVPRRGWRKSRRIRLVIGGAQ